MYQQSEVLIGLGNKDFWIAFYVESRPPIEPYYSLTQMQTLNKGQIKEIGDKCGNGWRKVFNVYAKLLFALPNEVWDYRQQADSWQQYRDIKLCQKESAEALLFSAPKLHFNQGGELNSEQAIHIIAGRTYAKKLLKQGLLQANFVWLNEQFAVDLTQRLIISPYLDYRQLSNKKIETLVTIICAVLKGQLPKSI